MLQAARAHFPADKSTFVKATAALVGAAALLMAAPRAEAQITRWAAVGVFKPSTNTFALDGNFDAARGRELPVRPGRRCSAARRSRRSRGPGPVLYRAGTWLFDLDRDGVPDKTVDYGLATDVR